MRIQSLNAGMINLTYQRNGQTLPITNSMQNNSISSKVDNNKNYVSIYGNNSQGIVSFAGVTSLMKRLLVNVLTHKKTNQLSQSAKMRTEEYTPRFIGYEYGRQSEFSEFLTWKIDRSDLWAPGRRKE